MTEKIAFEVRPKKGKKVQKVKFKGKISYLGEKISILPWQMAEQLAVRVDVKNVTCNFCDGQNCTSLLFCLD